MLGAWMQRRPPWWLVVFLVALAARCGYVIVFDWPLLYPTSSQYFWSALRLAQHPAPISYVLGSNEWCNWRGQWSTAPLYPLFLAGLLKLLGADLLALRLIQSGLGALTAVGVGALGFLLAGRRAALLAGLGMSICWPFVALPAETLTENLHTFLLVASLLTLAIAPGRASTRLALLGGALLGLSALARSTSLAFLPLAGLWCLAAAGGRRGARLALATILAGLAAIAPWTIRNSRLHGELVPIETASSIALWRDNDFASTEMRKAQEEAIHRPRSVATRRERALRFALQNVNAHRPAFALKVAESLRHLTRPEGLDLLLRREAPDPPGLHLARVVLDDGLFLGALALFVALALVRWRDATGGLLLLWTAYYVFMLVVPFHPEIRYRAALTPFLIAGAAAAVSHLGSTRGRREWLALALGVAVVIPILAPYAGRGLRLARMLPGLSRMRSAIAAGRHADALEEARRLSAAAPGSVRPWRLCGLGLAAAGQPLLAAQALEQGAALPRHTWLAHLVPPLLREGGQGEEAQRRAGALGRLPEGAPDGLYGWTVREAAWRALPPRRASCISMGREDIGAVRGVHDTRGRHRWTYGEASVRWQPDVPAASYLIRARLGAPPPAPQRRTAIRVQVNDQEPLHLNVGPDMEEITIEARSTPILLRIEAPAWSAPQRAVARGIRIDSVCAEPSK